MVDALEFLELVRQFIKCLFCMLIQMAADLQFHFGNLRIGLPLRVRIQAFAACMTPGLISGRWSKTASMARMRPSVSSFVMRFNLQIPEIRTAITAKENGPEGATSLRRAIALTTL